MIRTIVMGTFSLCNNNLPNPDGTSDDATNYGNRNEKSNPERIKGPPFVVLLLLLAVIRHTLAPFPHPFAFIHPPDEGSLATTYLLKTYQVYEKNTFGHVYHY